MHNVILKNLKFKHLINDITIDFLSSKNVVNMKDKMKKNVIQS